jgi:hypothetical protein
LIDTTKMAGYDPAAQRPARKLRRIGLLLASLLLAACQTAPPSTSARTDDTLIAAGRRFHTGTRIVTWMDPGGFNAYAAEPPKPGEPAGENHGARRRPATGGMMEPPRPPDLPALQKIVDQFVLHYDDEGFSKRCFAVLQRRHLSVHFLLDLDGTLYQTLDLRERAYHATIANSRSIGVEIASIGAFPPDQAQPLHAWYQRDASGRIRIKPPPETGDLGQRPPGFIARPARPQPVQGTINGYALEQYDFTPEQYAALIKLTAALHRIFPRIRLDYPRDAAGRPLPHKLSDQALDDYHGILGHFHIQANKVDPGPAFDWDRVIDGARRLEVK